MPSPTDSPTSFLQIVSEIVDDHKGATLPWYLRKPNALTALLLTTITTMLLGVVLASGWGMFVVPLGVAPLTMWGAVGLAMTYAVLRFRKPPDLTVALIVEESNKVDADPVRAAHLHAIEHIVMWAMPFFVLLTWAVLALVGCLV
jgi:hypothetical protein